MEGVLPKNHEGVIAGKESNALHRYHFGAQNYSYASSNDDARRKSGSGQRMGKLETNWCGI